MAASTNVAVLKFSCANNLSMNEKLVPWNHTTQPNMRLIIDSTRFGCSQDFESRGRILKVVRDSEILEVMAIEAMCQQARAEAANMSSQGYELTHHQLSVAAIVRCPCVALRYRTDDGKIRRLQVRLGSDVEFELVVNALKEVHCPMSYSPPRQHAEAQGQGGSIQPLNYLSSRPATASSVASMGAYNQFQNGPAPSQRFDHFQGRPHSAVNASPYTTSVSDIPIPNFELPTMGRDPARRESGYPIHTNRHYSTADAHTRGRAQDNFSLEFDAPQTLARPWTAPGLNVAASVGQPAFSAPPHELPFDYRPNSSRGGPGGHRSSSRPSTSALDLPPLPAPTPATASTGNGYGALSAVQITRPSVSETVASSAAGRATTQLAPIDSGKRPLDVTDENTTQAAAPAKSTKKRATAKNGKRRANNGKGKLAEVPANSVANPPLETQPQSQSQTATATRTQTESAAAADRDAVAQTVPPVLASAEEASNQTAPGPAAGPAPAMSSSALPAALSSLLTAAAAATADADADANADHATDSSKHTSSANLRAYAAQPADARARALEDLICAHIEDESFAVLCRDVEQAWQRVMLGF